MARVIAFAGTVYLARTLGATAYGTVGVATAALLYFTCIADGGIEVLGVREVASAPGRIVAWAPAVLSARIALSVILVVGLILAGVFVFPQPDGALLAGYSLILLNVAAGTRWIHLGLEDASRVAVSRIAGELVAVALLVTLVRRAEDIGHAPLAQFTGEWVAAFLPAWWLGRRGLRLSLRIDWPIAFSVFRRSWPLVAHALLGLVIFNSDLFFLRVYHASSTVGHYAAAYTLISFLLNLGFAYGQSLLPTLSRLADGESRGALYSTAMAHVFAAGFPVALGGSLLAGSIMEFFFGEPYLPSAPALAILLWSIPVAFLRNVPQTALVVAGRQDQVLRTVVVAAAVNLPLNLLLIPRWAMLGAAVATLATEVIRTGIAIALVRRAGFPAVGLHRFWRAAIAGGIMAAILAFVRIPVLWGAIAVGLVSYLVSLALLGGIRIRRGEPPELTV